MSLIPPSLRLLHADHAFRVWIPFVLPRLPCHTTLSWQQPTPETMTPPCAALGYHPLVQTQLELTSWTALTGRASTMHMIQPPSPPVINMHSLPKHLRLLPAHSRKPFVELPENSLTTPSEQLVPSPWLNLLPAVCAITWSRLPRGLQTSKLELPLLWLKTMLKSDGWNIILKKLKPGKLLPPPVELDSQLIPSLLTLKQLNTLLSALKTLHQPHQLSALKENRQLEGLIMYWPQLTEQKQLWLFLCQLKQSYKWKQVKKHITMDTQRRVLKRKNHGMNFQSQISSILFWALSLNHR